MGFERTKQTLKGPEGRHIALLYHPRPSTQPRPLKSQIHRLAATPRFGYFSFAPFAPFAAFCSRIRIIRVHPRPHSDVGLLNPRSSKNRRTKKSRPYACITAASAVHACVGTETRQTIVQLLGSSMLWHEGTNYA
jgi:hypothetical protein